MCRLSSRARITLGLSIFLVVSASGQIVFDHFENGFSLPQKDLDTLRERLGRVAAYTRTSSGARLSLMKTAQGQQVLTQAAEQGASEKCINETERMLLDVLAGKAYALTMLDSVGKPAAGILGGAVAWNGEYDACLNVSASSNDAGIRGQYCVASVGGQPGPPTNGIPSLSIRIGLCVPSACDANSTKVLIDAGLYALHYLGVTLDTNIAVACNKSVPYTTGDIVAFVLIGILVLLLLGGAIVDLVVRYRPQNVPGDRVAFFVSERKPNDENETLKIDGKVERERGTLVKILLAFSLITNGEKILCVENVRGDISCLHGLRLISMWWVILGHTFAASAMSITNPLKAFEITTTFAFQAVGNATFSVDTFFLLSGLLLTFLVMKEIKKSGPWLNWPLLYFHRFWRLTPLYAFVLLLTMTLMKHLTVGPTYVGRGSYISGSCDKYWWTNLLYINNFYPPSEFDICLLHTWYLANDMQFFIISPVLLILLYWNHIVGVGALLGTVVGSMILVGMFSTYWAIPAFPTSITPPAPQHGVLRGGWDIIYDKPYCRIQSYVIGMMMGYALYLTQCKRIFRINKVWITIGWLVTAFICLVTVYGTYWDIKDHIILPLGVSSFYNSTARVAWCFCMCWVIFACVHGYGGPVNSFLSWSAFVPLSRLTYGAYLIHFAMIEILLARQREPSSFTYVSVSYLIIGHIVLSYAVAFILSLLVEAPMIALEKILFRRKK